MDTLPSPNDVDMQRVQALQVAFAQFNETSMQLQSSWAALQQQVAELTRERDHALQARLEELAAREQVAQRLHALLEALPGAVVMVDASGVVRACNVGAEELLGRPLLGETWRDVAARALRARTENDGTLCLMDGHRLGVSRRATPDGGYVLLLTDESEAHARRSGLQRQQKIAHDDQQQARLAHQLRTPLATAVLHLSRIAEGLVDPEKTQQLAQKSLARLYELQNLINQTLALARGTATMDEMIGVHDLLHDACRHLPEHAIVQIETRPPDLQVCGQRSLLLSVLVSLLDNALAFASQVSLQASHRGEHVLIAVQDDGPGVEPRIAARIFEPFFTTRPEGTGLGLAMAQRIIEAHGGRLILVPDMQGARFEICLPMGDTQHALGSGFVMNPEQLKEG